MTQKDLIRKLIRENIDLNVTDETMDTTRFDIYYKNRKAGHISCGPASSEDFGKDTIEITDLHLDDDYETLNVASQAVNALWEAYPDIQRILGSLPKISTHFWEKLGFNRMNETYYFSMRGH